MADRRYDLDWLRIGAFALLIFYHIGMVFVPWDFHIKTAHASAAVEAPMLLLNPWRLPLLFLISGTASRYLFMKRKSNFAASRCKRLLLPILFSVVVVVPPQVWIDVTINHNYRMGFLGFWATDYWRFDKSLGVVVPTYQHLWFVVYLWVYTMIMALVAAVISEEAGEKLQAAFDALFRGWRLIVLPVIGFAAARILLIERFPETHALIDDWYMHLVYGASFAMGFGLAGSRTAWTTIGRVWPYAAIAALLGWGTVIWVNNLPDAVTLTPIELMAARTMRTVQMWGAILGLLGFAQRFLNHDHRWRTTLNEAVFPAYIAHQTIIIAVEYWLRPYGLSSWVEFAVLVPATAGGSAMFYLLGRRVLWLRPMIGLSSARSPGVRSTFHVSAQRATNLADS
jgi:glucans biosynthesis protein C